jgi:hypothetical protein
MIATTEPRLFLFVVLPSFERSAAGVLTDEDLRALENLTPEQLRRIRQLVETLKAEGG